MTRSRSRHVEPDPPGFVSPFFMMNWCRRGPLDAKGRQRHGRLKRIKQEWSNRLEQVRKGLTCDSRLNYYDLMHEWCEARDKVRHYAGWD